MHQTSRFLCLISYKVDQTKHTPVSLLQTNIQETNTIKKKREGGRRVQLITNVVSILQKRTLEATFHDQGQQTTTQLHISTNTLLLVHTKPLAASLCFCKIDTKFRKRSQSFETCLPSSAASRFGGLNRSSLVNFHFLFVGVSS